MRDRISEYLLIAGNALLSMYVIYTLNNCIKNYGILKKKPIPLNTYLKSPFKKAIIATVTDGSC